MASPSDRGTCHWSPATRSAVRHGETSNAIIGCQALVSLHQVAARLHGHVLLGHATLGARLLHWPRLKLGALGILGAGEVGGFFASRPPLFKRLIAIGETLVEFLDCLSMFVLDPFDLRPGGAGL
jgi:hypothetical protein